MARGLEGEGQGALLLWAYLSPQGDLVEELELESVAEGREVRHFLQAEEEFFFWVRSKSTASQIGEFVIFSLLHTNEYIQIWVVFEFNLQLFSSNVKYFTKCVNNKKPLSDPTVHQTQPSIHKN